MTLTKFGSRNHSVNDLNALYARFAKKWHNAILRLGFMNAYQLLTRFDQERRIRPANVVLDVGTGTGALAKAFVENRPDVTSLSLLDASPEMLQEACLNLADIACEVHLIPDLIGTPQIKGSTIDTLLCAHVIEHTPTPLESLRWFFKVLRPNGTLLLSVSKPHWCTAIVRWRWGHKAYPPEQTCAMLAEAGFTDVEMITYPSGPPSRVSCGFWARKPAE